MLILSHPDALGIDFYKLCQRVLQSAAKGHCASGSDIKIRIFLRCQLGSRIYRCSCFVYYCILNVIALFFNKVCHDFLCFPGCRAVSDYYYVRMIFFYNFLQHRLSAFDVVLRLRRIDGGIGLQLAGLVQYCHLAARSVARVNGNNALPLYRRRHKQTFRVPGKNLNCFCLGSFCKEIPHFSFYGRCHKSLIGISDSVLKKSQENTLFVLDYAAGDYIMHLFRICFYLHLQLLFLFSPVNGQNSVVWNFGKGFLMVVIHFIDGLFFRIHSFCRNHAGAESLFSHVLGDFRIIGNHLRNNVAGSLKCLFRCVYFFFSIYKRFSRFLGSTFCLKLGEDDHSKRFQSLFLGLGSACGFLLPVRFIKVFYPLKHLRFLYFLAKVFCQLALLVNETDYLFLPLFQISQVFKSFVQVAECYIGKSSGDLFTVSCDKGDGVPFVNKLNGVLHLCASYFKFACKFLNYVHIFVLFPSSILIFLLKLLVYEIVKIPVHYRVYIGGFGAGSVIFYHCVGLENI